MIPILFEHDTTVFTGNGIGFLVDTLDCVVKCSDDTTYEMELRYPIESRLASELTINRIILVKANSRDPNQAFRIYGYDKSFDGTMTVKCQHISYDLNDVLFFPYAKAFGEADHYQGKCIAADYYAPSTLISDVQNSDYLLTTNPFSFSQEYISYGHWPFTKTAHVTVTEPTTVRNVLFGSSNSLISEFGGMCFFDNYNVRFYGGNHTPSDLKTNGLIVEYGKDLIDVTQEENISEMYTGILPYYKGKDRAFIGNSNNRFPESVVHGDILYASGTFQRHHIEPVCVNDYFQESETIDLDIWESTTYPPSVEWIPAKVDVNNAGEDYLNEGQYGIPDVNLTIDYVDVNSDVRVYDIATVRFLNIGIDVNVRVTELEYDVLHEKVQSVSLGKTKTRDFWYNFGHEYNKRSADQ